MNRLEQNFTFRYLFAREWTNLKNDSISHEDVESRWSESARASAGLTSDDIHKKGSLAVQAMLRWLEVSRLTRATVMRAPGASSVAAE